MSKQTSLARQSAWILIAKVIGFALNLSLPLLTVRYFSQGDFGVYRQSFLVATNATSILPLGFSMSAYYFLNREPERRHSVIINILIFNFAAGGLAFLTFLLAPQILGSVFQNDKMVELAPYIGGVIWLWIFSNLLEVIPLANQEARLASVMILFTQVTKMIFWVASLLLVGTVEALLYASLAHAILQSCALLVYLNQRFSGYWKSYDWGFFRTQLGYALPFGLAALLYTSQTDVHNYFVGYHYGPAEFAIYSVGCFQIPLIWIIYESISAVVIPRISQLQSEGKKREMLLITISAVQKLAAVFLPLFFFLEIVATEFITIVFTKDYLASVPIFRINLILLPFFCIMVDPIGRAFPEIGKFLLKLRAAVLVALIVGLTMFTEKAGLTGIITIVVAAVLFELLVTVWRSIKALEVNRRDIYLLNILGKTLLATVAVAAVFFLLYLFLREPLLAVCNTMSSQFLVYIGVAKGAELLGGGAFLALSFLLFAVMYIFVVFRTNVIDTETRGRMSATVREFWRLGRSS